MKTPIDLIKEIQNLKDEEIDYLYSIMRFLNENRIRKNYFSNLFEKLVSQYEFANTLLFVLLNKFTHDGIEEAASTMAQISTNYVKKFFIIEEKTLNGVIKILNYFNCFVLCGQAKLFNKNENDIIVHINNCQFEKNKIFCDFTFTFLENLFRLILKDRMITCNSIIPGNKREHCVFTMSIKEFQHIKVLYLE